MNPITRKETTDFPEQKIWAGKAVSLKENAFSAGSKQRRTLLGKAMTILFAALCLLLPARETRAAGIEVEWDDASLYFSCMAYAEGTEEAQEVQFAIWSENGSIRA